MLNVIAGAYLSIMAATPIPPAVQTEMRHLPEPFSSNNFAAPARILAPVAAKG